MNDLDPTTAANLSELATCLREAHLLADKPSYRTLEKQTVLASGFLPGTKLERTRLTRSVLGDMLCGRKLPRKAFLLTFVEACGIDVENDPRWELAWDRLAPQYQQGASLSDETQKLRHENEELRRQLAAAKRRTRAARARAMKPSQSTTDSPWSRIAGYEPLLSPCALLDELPLDEEGAVRVKRTRAEVRDVLNLSDDRMLVIVGPCSVHDPAAALEYARRLTAIRARLADDLLIVMRVYFEQSRPVTGWKGLINDPAMDNSYDVHRGLRTGRRLLLDIVGLGLPVGYEWLDPITPEYIADAVTWGAIGARTTESQVHWQLASGLSMPVGFKNGTDGDVQVAVDACRTAASGHTFFNVTSFNQAAVVTTAGNPDTHVMLCGGRSGPNYEAGHVAEALDLVTEVGLPRRLMVDASQGNSQPVAVALIAEQVAAGEDGLAGVMLKSFLREGRQEPGPPATLTYGQSVTDACMDFETTIAVLDDLAAAVRSRRNWLSLAGRRIELEHLPLQHPPAEAKRGAIISRRRAILSLLSVQNFGIYQSSTYSARRATTDEISFASRFRARYGISPTCRCERVG
jgi:3-deoxy-7-phosphoheptulonate synthase